MSTFDGPRGLIGYAQFATASDERVELQESSAVMSYTINGEIEGPFVWLRVERGESGCFAHLSVRDATELRNALSDFLASADVDQPVARLQCLKCGRRWISRSDVTRDQWIALQRDFATHICESDVEIGRQSND